MSLTAITLYCRASLSGASNRTVAARWKTIETFSTRIFSSSLLIPIPGLLMSPATGTMRSKASGEFIRRFVNNCMV